MRRRTLFIVAGLTVVAAIIVVALLLGASGPNGGEAQIRLGALVRAERPVRRDFEETVSYPGVLVPAATVTAVSKVAGKVKQVVASEGDVVIAEQTLVVIDAEAVDLQHDQAAAAWQAADAQYQKALRGARQGELDNARASFRQAEEDLAVAEKNLERSKRLYDTGTIAASAYEESENSLNSARTKLDNARRSVSLMEEGATSEDLSVARANAEAMKAQYEIAKLQADAATIEAPVSGTIARISVEEGNLVAAGTPLATIVAIDPIRVNIAVPERHYSRFSSPDLSLEVRVSPIAFPDMTPFPGIVASVSPVIDTGTRTFGVEGSISNNGLLLRPGMYVNTVIVVGTRRDVLVVPQTAVLLRRGHDVVFRLREQSDPVVEMVEVETGYRSGGSVEVVSGIGESDLIVVEGNAFLEDGQPVRVVQAGGQS